MGSPDRVIADRVSPDCAISAPEVEPFWAAFKDEELLNVRICDLKVRMEGSELEPRIRLLYDELASRQLALRPPCYLGDEWLSPNGVPAIAIPFYLAHPRLKTLELHQMLEVEGGTAEWCQKLLRHECGHAIDHAYRLSARPEWASIFGNPEQEYNPECYRPRPYSRSYVRHLPNWYAQAHPDEDFAETFAVWLSMSTEGWREQYRGWKALEKLEYVDGLMREVTATEPTRVRIHKIAEAKKSRRTLGRYYAERRRRFAEDFPDAYDDDLRLLFNGTHAGGETAAHFIRRNRRHLITSIVRWTGQPKYTVDMMVRRQTKRCEQLGLLAPADTASLSFDLGAYLATLLTNHLHTGRFKRSV